MLATHSRLVHELDAELERDHGLPLSSYEVLMNLADAEGNRLRMGELADRLLLSRSRDHPARRPAREAGPDRAPALRRRRPRLLRPPHGPRPRAGRRGAARSPGPASGATSSSGSSPMRSTRSARSGSASTATGTRTAVAGGPAVRLYRAEWSTNCERVGLALAHKGIEAQSVLIEYSNRAPGRGDQRPGPGPGDRGRRRGDQRLGRDPAPPRASARPNRRSFRPTRRCAPGSTSSSSWFERVYKAAAERDRGRARARASPTRR